MDSEKQWEVFQKSGKISDYLRYRELLLAETAQELTPTEGQDAAEDGRRGDPRKGDGGE